MRAVHSSAVAPNAVDGPLQNPMGARPMGLEVRLEGITKRFGGLQAVDSIDLEIPAGSFVTLLGPSGSGKTTTLNLVAGFLSPDEGAIRFDGQDVSNLPPQHRNIGMVFQSYALFPHMTVFENVAYPLRMREKLERSQMRERVKETLALVQLEQFEARYPRQLSGGQQQRVAMARALVGRPRLLLMDEPLGALDKKLREQLQVEIKSIHKQVGSTFIYVTHDQSEALTMSDLVVVMSNARIAQVGTPKELYESPATTFVADFLGGANLLPGRVVSVEGNETYQLELEDGSVLSIEDTANWSSGDQVRLFVRPEDIQLVTPTDPVALLRARVENVLYLGEALRVTARVGNIAISAKSPRDSDLDMAPGNLIGLKWSARHARLLRPEIGQ